MLDTAAARQQLLLRQQQEVLAYTHNQQVEQQAQQLVNNALAVGTTSTTPADRQLQNQADRHVLNNLLNEACILTPQRPPLGGQAGVAWMPAQPVLNNQGLYNPVTVLGAPMPGAHGTPPPGAPGGFQMMGQDELMQAVRKELKRMQQE